jgi:hypothetical protein
MNRGAATLGDTMMSFASNATRPSFSRFLPRIGVDFVLIAVAESSERRAETQATGARSDPLRGFPGVENGMTVAVVSCRRGAETWKPVGDEWAEDLPEKQLKTETPWIDRSSCWLFLSCDRAWPLFSTGARKSASSGAMDWRACTFARKWSLDPSPHSTDWRSCAIVE